MKKKFLSAFICVNLWPIAFAQKPWTAPRTPDGKPDPATFTKPFTGQVPMNKMQGPIIEYACHEGNYAMSGMLAGARADEAKGPRADEAKK